MLDKIPTDLFVATVDPTEAVPLVVDFPCLDGADVGVDGTDVEVDGMEGADLEVEGMLLFLSVLEPGVGSG